MAEARRTRVFCLALAPSPPPPLASASPEQLAAWECLPQGLPHPKGLGTHGAGRACPPGAGSVLGESGPEAARPGGAAQPGALSRGLEGGSSGVTSGGAGASVSYRESFCGPMRAIAQDAAAPLRAFALRECQGDTLSGGRGQCFPSGFDPRAFTKDPARPGSHGTDLGNPPPPSPSAPRRVPQV